MTIQTRKKIGIGIASLATLVVNSPFFLVGFYGGFIDRAIVVSAAVASLGCAVAVVVAAFRSRKSKARPYTLLVLTAGLLLNAVLTVFNVLFVTVM